MCGNYLVKIRILYVKMSHTNRNPPPETIHRTSEDVVLTMGVLVPLKSQSQRPLK